MAGLTQTIRWVMDAKQATTTMQRLSGQVGAMRSQMTSLAASVGVAFGTQQLVSFAHQAAVLAGKVEGVKTSFDALGDGALLSKLNAATANTVSNLELMQKSVLAVKLGIDQAQLPTYFAFASKMAQETGESVDYMVDSIVRGVGRQSALILDNLGISAMRLADELKKGGTYAEAVSRIINEEMAKSGGVLKTTATAADMLNKNLEDTKAELGKNLIPLWTEMLGVVNKIVVGVRVMSMSQKEIAAERSRKGFDVIIKNAEDQGQAFTQVLGVIDQYRLKIKEVDAEIAKMNPKMKGLISRKQEEKEVAQAAIDEYLKLYDAYSANNMAAQEAQRVAKSQATTLGSLKELVTALTNELDTATNNADYRKITHEIELLNAQIDKLTDTSRGKIVLPELVRPSSANVLNGTELTPAVVKPLAPVVDSTAVQNWLNHLAVMEQATKDFNEGVSQAITGAAIDFTAGMSQLIGMAMVGQASFADFGKFALSSLADLMEQLGKIALATGFAVMGIKRALESLNPAAAIAAGVALLALSGAVRGALGNMGRGNTGGQMPGGSYGGFGVGQYGAGVPAFAQGGIVTGPTLAMVGEGRESEAILPLSKLNQLVDNVGGSLTGKIKVEGRELYILLNRETNRQKRIS